MKRLCAIIGLCCCLIGLDAQIPCDSIGSQFRQWNARLDKLNTEDPEIITLHYYFLQDIRKEMDRFKATTLPHLVKCLQTDYYLTRSQFNRIAYKSDRLDEILSERKKVVDHLFYLRAQEEMAFSDTSAALYNLDRALQFNKYNPDALLLKAQLRLRQSRYKESVDLIHLLYTKSELNDEQEKAVSDFSLQLYDKLYSIGNAYIQSGRSADALEVFLALEQFCSNMPSGYCNDDYYHGILLSREGVYESYLAIAREAERRHNMEMARKFYQYADEYRKNNQRKEE